MPQETVTHSMLHARRRIALWIAIAGLAVTAHVACGDDESSSSSGGTTTSGSGGSTTTGSGGSTTSGGGMGGSGPSCMLTAVGECTDVSNPTACECCAAENCETEVTACCNEPGCIAVVNCVVATDCESIACYDDATCKAEIDAAGGLLSAGVTAAQAVGDCVEVPCMGCSDM
jgi:hypothetical protein